MIVRFTSIFVRNRALIRTIAYGNSCKLSKTTIKPLKFYGKQILEAKTDTSGEFKEWLNILMILTLVSLNTSSWSFSEEQSENTSNGNEENEDFLNILPNYKAVPSLKRNRDSSICGSSQYSANKPIEDRLAIEKLQNGGWWFAVFDGHGGWQCSDYAHEALHKNFELELNNHLGYFPKQDSMFSRLTDVTNDRAEEAYTGKISSKVIVNALKAAFKRTDRQYMGKVTGAFELGFGRDTRAGSCAIAVFIIDGVLFCANSGDCRAIVVSSKNVTKEESQKLGRFSRFIKRATETSILVPRLQASYEQKVERRITKVDPSKYLDQVTGIKEELAQIALRKSLGYKCDPEAEQNLRQQLFILLEQTKDTFSEVSESILPSREITPEPSRLKKLASFLFSTATTEGHDTETANTLLPDDIASVDLSKYVEAITVSNDHNAKIKTEQEKLQRKHPNEVDLVLCKNANSCYVKGRLQPTRAFGDFHLKYSEFQLPKKSENSSRKAIPFTPPYITCVPEIIVRPITKEAKQSDEILIIGSDGLWDMISNQEAAEKVLRWIRIEGLTPKQASDRLVEEVLETSAAKHNLTLEELKALKKGRQRRTKHDDITVVIVDLSQLMDFFYFG